MKRDKQTILLVDDNPHNLQVLGNMLQENGYHVAATQTGANAIEFLKTNKPCLILLDILMPIMNGFEVCEKLKRNHFTKDIPIIFITALDDVENKLKAFTMGGSDYITRPFIKEEVLARVNVAVQNKTAEEQLRKALKEKETLLQEIHHRVKNNMQVISSLLNLQSTQASTEKDRMLFLDCKNRIHSMALVHEKLYAMENLAAINIQDYITNLVKDLRSFYHQDQETIDIKIETDKSSLGINHAVPCAMLINELITNALKYAFPPSLPSSPTTNHHNQISVRFFKTSLSSETEYCLEVNDNGTGIPSEVDLEEKKTLGLQLIHALTQQLNGSLQIQRQNGTQITIIFKV